MNNIPPGLKFLQGERQTEEDTKKFLEGCCGIYNKLNCTCCLVTKECKKLYSTRCNRNPREGGWGWSHAAVYRDPAVPYQPDIVRYSDYLPRINRLILRDRIRESVIGGMR